MDEFDWDSSPELNITPLVDVMLVLLAILMVIAPTVIYEEMIKLPQGSATQQIQEKAPVHITINEHSQVIVNKENFDLETFSDNFYLYSQKLDKEATVLISADKGLEYGIVMSILGAVKQAGFTEVSLATSG